MFWKRIYLKKIVNRDHLTRRPRIRRTTNDHNTLFNPLMNDLGDKGTSRKRKVEHLSSNLREGRVMKKRKTKENRGVDDMDAGINRISDLPEPVIHQIFANLHTKDVVRMSILSKWWKSMFDSFLVFDFDESYFQVRGVRGKHNWIKAREVQKKKFNRYVEKSLVSRLESVPCIEKFRLYVRNLDFMRWIYMDQWLDAAVAKNLKELEIHVANKRNYFLPDSVISSTTITSLKLSACHGTCYYMNFCNLRILSVKDTLFSEHMIQNFARSCPLIEDVRLVHCRIFKFSISTLVKLRRVELHHCKDLNHIEIDAPNLETFWYHAKRKRLCRILLKGCTNLKHLVLKDLIMRDSSFAYLLSKCPLLETLVLQQCRNLQRLTILSSKLKSLALIHCQNLQEITIDAPDLYSFQYNDDGDKLPFFSMNASKLHEAKFYFVEKKTSDCFAENKKFFENFDESKGAKLITYYHQDMKIYEDFGDAYRSDDSFDKVELSASSTGVLRIIDKWLREAHGHSLTLVCPRSDGLWKLICAMIENREQNPECCRFLSSKCWRHCLASVEVVNFSFKFEWKPRPSKKRLA